MTVERDVTKPLNRQRLECYNCAGCQMGYENCPSELFFCRLKARSQKKQLLTKCRLRTPDIAK
jgi:hypothetical protein